MTTQPEVKLSIKGKMFRYQIGDSVIPLLDDEGYPVYKIAFRIVDTKEIRRYYANAWTSDSKPTPQCWSDDGIKHAPDVVEYQAHSCSACARAKSGCNKMLEVTAVDQNGMKFEFNLTQSSIHQDSHKPGWVKFADIESDVVVASFDSTPYPKLVFRNI